MIKRPDAGHCEPRSMIGAVALHGTSSVRPPPVVVAGDAAPTAARRRTADAAEDRFRRIVVDHFDFIWRALRGLGVPSSSVDDAAQNVFLVAAQKLDAITEGSERSFLFATARGIASNARRSQGRSRETADDDAVLARADDAPDPEQLTATKRARETLDRILEGLPEDARTVFVLYELEGLTMAEIATLLDLPPGTVASRLRRAREEFQAAARRFQSGGGT